MDVARFAASGSNSSRCLLSTSATDTRKQPKDELLIQIRTDGPDELDVGMQLCLAGSSIGILELRPCGETVRQKMTLNLRELRSRTGAFQILLQRHESALEETERSRAGPSEAPDRSADDTVRMSGRTRGRLVLAIQPNSLACTAVAMTVPRSWAVRKLLLRHRVSPSSPSGFPGVFPLAFAVTWINLLQGTMAGRYHSRDPGKGGGLRANLKFPPPFGIDLA